MKTQSRHNRDTIVRSQRDLRQKMTFAANVYSQTDTIRPGLTARKPEGKRASQMPRPTYLDLLERKFNGAIGIYGPRMVSWTVNRPPFLHAVTHPLQSPGERHPRICAMRTSTASLTSVIDFLPSAPDINMPLRACLMVSALTTQSKSWDR